MIRPYVQPVETLALLGSLRRTEDRVAVILLWPHVPGAGERAVRDRYFPSATRARGDPPDAAGAGGAEDVLMVSRSSQRPAMKLRAFNPGIDGDPQRNQPRFRDSGSTFEPAHRQLVLVHLNRGRSMEARYSRDTGRFWLRFGPGDYMEIDETPETWEQLAPLSREARAA